MSSKIWEMTKWFSTMCYVFGTMLLLSPVIAATAITPWIIFIIGNTIQFTNFIHQRNIPFMCLSIFFYIWDSLIIVQRLTSNEIFSIITPLITLMENHII